MTLVLAWFEGTDSDGSVSVAADSLLSERIEVTGRETASWDRATKIFRVWPSKDYVAYTGKSLLALTAIHQFTAAIGSTEVIANRSSPESRMKAFAFHLPPVLASFPKTWANYADLLYVGYCERTSKPVAKVIKLGPSKYNVQDPKWVYDTICLGSAAKNAERRLEECGEDGITSGKRVEVLRAVIDDEEATAVGGVPQMVTISRCHSTPQAFVEQLDGQSTGFLFGMPLCYRNSMQTVQFRNEEFDVVQNPCHGKITPPADGRPAR